MITVPSDKKELLKLSNELIEQCRVSIINRAGYCRLMNAIAETGRIDGQKSLLNLLNGHLERTAGHLFSPVELKFSIDFERIYNKTIYEQAAVAAQVLTRSWDRKNTDILFGQGVYESLKYGWAGMKQWVQIEGSEETPNYYSKLVMPWQFGVYNESENDLNRQPALCETTSMTLPEIWRRIYFMENAEKLFNRIKAHASKGGITAESQGYFHQILSASQINTGVSAATRPLPGGIVQLGNDPNYAVMGPQIAADMVQVHELWVQDDDDYTTIIMVEPDVIISPQHKKSNLLVKDSRLQPYRSIQPNMVTNWFWGRSELTDLIEPQQLLSTNLEDFKRLFGLQVDKILAFTGETTITDELYGQFRGAGYTSLGQGADVKDLTPKMPEVMMPWLKFLIDEIHKLGGFPPIMQGTGEAGVRAGSHASTLMKTGSPTLRDRALLVERQCADHADLTLSIREAKDSSKYWTKADNPLHDPENTSFVLSQLPSDWRVTVDSHSSSPIFADENTQLVMAAHKMGIVDGEYVIDNVSLPNKAAAKTGYKETQKRKAEQFQQLMRANPEAAEKAALKGITGGRR